jgi:hypothetical protein
MFEIAGGILLAIAVLYVLPTLLTLAFYTTLIIVLLVVIGIIYWFIFVVKDGLLLFSLVCGVIFYFTIGTALLGLVITKFPLLKNQYVNKLAISNDENKKLFERLKELYNYYYSIGLNYCISVGFFIAISIFIFFIYTDVNKKKTLVTDVNANKQTTSENLTISQTEQFSLQARCFEIIKNHKLCKEQNKNCDELNSISETDPLTFLVCMTEHKSLLNNK